ncbi:hypothetical protein OH782_42385 (plasmid) [Streptomyces sp. NBC_01544]|uniref:hypothetical protein n=1 Tax=Streptomyces sp. NBC_01544 TaxID=2975871 RepID=UPI003868A9AD
MLRTIAPKRAQVILAVVVYGASPAEVAQRMGISTSSATRMISTTLSAMRHPSRSQVLRDHFIDEGDDELVIDSDLRGLIRQWRIEENLVPRCATCDALLPPTTSWEGRPREYCSNACRQKAYRRRKTDAHMQSGGPS